MNESSLELTEAIHMAGCPFVLAVTGGGSRSASALLEVPGASASVLEVVVPYARTALEQWLGGSVDAACSQRTACAMAMAAFDRARQLGGANVHSLRGIAATASLATKRGRQLSLHFVEGTNLGPQRPSTSPRPPTPVGGPSFAA